MNYIMLFICYLFVIYLLVSLDYKTQKNKNEGKPFFYCRYNMSFIYLICHSFLVMRSSRVCFIICRCPSDRVFSKVFAINI